MVSMTLYLSAITSVSAGIGKSSRKFGPSRGCPDASSAWASRQRAHGSAGVARGAPHFGHVAESLMLDSQTRIGVSCYRGISSEEFQEIAQFVSPVFLRTHRLLDFRLDEFAQALAHPMGGRAQRAFVHAQSRRDGRVALAIRVAMENRLQPGKQSATTGSDAFLFQLLQ